MKKLISFLLVITMALSFSGYYSKAFAISNGIDVNAGPINYPEKATDGFISEEGYVLYYINREIKQIEFKYAIDAKLTVNESKAVLLDSFGSLVYYDFEAEVEEAKEISTIATGIYEVKNDGLLYTVFNGETTELYYYSFQLNNSIEISRNMDALDDIIISIGNDLHVVYADDYCIYQIESTFDEPQRIGRYQNVVFLKDISRDGSKIIWSDAGTESEEVFIFENNDIARVCTYEPVVKKEDINYISSNTKAEFSSSGKYCIISNTSSEVVYLKLDGDEDAKVYHLRSKCSDPYKYNPNLRIFTENGPLRYDSSEDIKSFYIQAGYDFYYLTVEGEYDRIATNCRNYAISNGYLYYVTERESVLGKYSLYCAKISADRITDDRCYAKNWGLGWFLPIGDYVYYYNMEGSPYNCVLVNKALVSAGDDDRVVEDYFKKLYISPDGEFSYYSENNKFYRYSYESRERFEIAKDVELVSKKYIELPAYGVGRNYITVILLDNDFIYGKYKYAGGEAKYYDFYYFDGNNSEKILSGSPVYQ